MKLLITGGCGFLGSNLAADAIQRGDELFILDNLSRVGATENFAWIKGQGEFQFSNGDIRDADEVTRVVREFKPDAVFHLAGQVAMTTSIRDPRLDFEINALGTLNLLEAVRNYAPNATVIYSSTNKVYGDLSQFSYREKDTRYECVEHPNGFDESTQISFASPYGCSKGSADQYILDYARVFSLPTVVLRHSSMYGGRQFATVDQGWIGWFCQEAINGARSAQHFSLEIAGSGKQVRDVLHAEDVKNLYRACVDQISVARGQVFNVGGGMSNSISIIELVEILASRLNVAIEIKRNPPRKSDQLFFVADTTKIEHLLGWRPRVSIFDGLNEMLAWCRDQIS